MVMLFSFHKHNIFAIKSFGLIRIFFVLLLLFIVYNFSKNAGSILASWLAKDLFYWPVREPYKNLSIDHRFRNITPLFYRHATSERNSSYPFISGDTFRGFADYVFDEIKTNDLESVKFGDIVFVKADMLHQFFDRAYASIKNPFVLVTHNSDFSAPNEFASKLNDTKILVWYASNPDRSNHPKLMPIPIGLANNRWEHGNVVKLKYAFENYRKPWSQRSTLLYVNFAVGTNKVEREAALVEAQKFKNLTMPRTRISFDTYLQQVGDAKFVLSPPGNGIDCHRTWEAILMGAAPVVMSSALDPLFKNMPALIIKQWSELKEDHLLSLKFSSNDSFVAPVIWGQYWLKKLYVHRFTNQTR